MKNYLKKSQKILNKKFILFIGGYIVVLVAITLIVMKKSYARYVSDMDIHINSTTGEMICDLEVDNNSYFENNIPYFIITIKNYNSNNEVTATDVEYVLNITNETNSNGLFYYIAEDDGSTNGKYEPSLAITNLTFDKNKSTKRIKVYVKVQSSQHEIVNFNVNLDAIQKKM